MADPDEVATVPDPEAARGGMPPLELERYEIEKRIGKGGMGEVFLARDRTMGREVAIKRMIAPDASARSIARFVREARIQARLDHPAIVPVHELGTDADGRPYFVMKRLRGRTLREVLRGTTTLQPLLRAYVDVCLAVEYAHAHGVIHRDLKPENIVLGDFGEVYVLDWGVAKLLGDDDAPTTEASAQDEAVATVAGAAVGTPGYMAPEQSRGQGDIDHRIDVWALGCILFEILHDASDVPPELDALCARAMVVEREDRLGSARELATRVQDYLDGDRDLASRRALADSHLVQARASLAGDSPEQRAVAMREAGLALALDPTRTDAAEIVTRMMLEPPTVAPPEVERALEAEQFAMFRRNAVVSVFALGGMVVIALLILWQTQANATDVAIIAGITGACMAVTAWVRTRTRLPALMSAFAMIGLAVVVFVFARMYPPFFVAPILAAMITIMTPFTLQYVRLRSSAFIAFCMVVAIFVPLVGEQLGWLASTYTIVPEGIVFHTPALRGPESWQVAIVVLYIVTVIAFSAWIGYTMRTTERGARRQLHLQAWQLQQLVRR